MHCFDFLRWINSFAFSYSISGRYYFGLPSEGTEKFDGDLEMGIQYRRGLFRVLNLTQDGLHLNAGKPTNLLHELLINQDVLTKCCYEFIDITEFVGKYLNISQQKYLIYKNRVLFLST